MLKIQSFIQVPNFVAKLFNATLGRLIDTSSKTEQNLQSFGATLELQRQENMERLEQQLLLQSIRNSQNGRNLLIGRPQPQVNLSKEQLTLSSPVTIFVVCFSHRLMFLGSLFSKQYGPRSDCSHGSLIRVYIVYFIKKNLV